MKYINQQTIVQDSRGSLMLVSLVVLGVVALSGIYLSLILLSEIRNTRYADNAIVAHYVAESGTENALWSIKMSKDEGADFFLGNANAVLCAGEPGTTETSCLTGEPGSDSERFYEFTVLELAAEDFVVHDVPQNSPAFVDIYDPSQEAAKIISTGINQVNIHWFLDNCAIDSGNTSAKLEISYTPITFLSGDLVLGDPETRIQDPCGCTPSGEYIDPDSGEPTGLYKCSSDDVSPSTFFTVSPNSFYRISLRSIDAPAKRIEVTTNNSTLPSQIDVEAVGTFRDARSSVRLRASWKEAISGIFNYVIFSEDSLIKDTQSGAANTYETLCGYCTGSVAIQCSSDDECGSETCTILNDELDPHDWDKKESFCWDTTGGETYSTSGIVQLDTGSCNAQCNGLTYCGDQILQIPNGALDGGPGDIGNEDCDNGPYNSNTTPNACRTDCTFPVCGDGVTDGSYGEQCDDGNVDDGDECTNSCVLNVSGDVIEVASVWENSDPSPPPDITIVPEWTPVALGTELRFEDTDWIITRATQDHLEYDSQLYKFQLNNGSPIDSLDALLVRWFGHGDDNVSQQLQTTLYIWDPNIPDWVTEEVGTSASNFLPSDSWLSYNPGSNPNRFLVDEGGTKYIYVMVTAQHSNYSPTDNGGRWPVVSSSVSTGSVNFSWNIWSDADSDTVEHDIEVFNGSGCSGSLFDSGTDISDTSWSTVIQVAGSYSWRLYGRSAGYSTDDTVEASDGCVNFSTTKSSCPFIYAWDGDEYKYITEISGGAFNLAGGRVSQYYDTNMLIPITPEDGKYKILIRESIEEIAYVDDIELISVEHDPGVEIVHTGLQKGNDVDGEYKIFSVTNPSTPIQVIDKTGDDVTELISNKDGIAPPAYLDKHDYFDITINVTNPKNAKLLLDTWGFISKIIDAEVYSITGPNIYPYIEMQGYDGNWHKVAESVYTSGDMKSLAIDVSDIVSEGEQTLRFHTGLFRPLIELVIDRIRFDDSAPEPYSLTVLKPSRADLNYRGIATFESHLTTSTRQMVLDDEQHEDFNMYYGYFTKYGDVKSLLDNADDKYVIMRRGDQLSVEFDQPQEMEDKEYTTIISSYTWFKTPKNKDGSDIYSVTPLPFKGMTEYPYETEQYPYNGSSEYNNYIKNWNTRYCEKGDSFCTDILTGQTTGYVEKQSSGVLNTIKNAFKTAVEFIKDVFITKVLINEGVENDVEGVELEHSLDANRVFLIVTPTPPPPEE